MLQHGIENGQQLMHARRQGDFVDFPRREEPLVKSFALRVGARGHQCAHRQHGAHRSAPAPDRAPTAAGPTVAIAGRHAASGRAVLPCARPQLGKFQPQRAGTHGPKALGTLQQGVVFPPQWASVACVGWYGVALRSPPALVRQAKLGVSCGVEVPTGEGLANHPYRVLHLERRSDSPEQTR